MHSGLQFGADPLKFGWQAHMGLLPLILHMEFGPQGEGSQGST